MGCMPIYGTAGATGGGFSHQRGSHPFTFRDQYYPQWDRGGARGPRTWKDRFRFVSLWSFGCRAGYGTPSGTDGAAPVGRSMAEADLFEPYSCDGEGTQSLKWILGQCLDASGNAAAGSIVQCFRTSDDAFAGEVNANSTDGTFAVPTPYVGASHYLVAYKPGSPDTGGTTVNTLTPTNIDGT